ncbi:unnamed protein product [Caenorhabditis brenneri]
MSSTLMFLPKCPQPVVGYEVLRNVRSSTSQPETIPQPSHWKFVVCKLKWGMKYKGVLVVVDSYMNLQLAHAEEYIDGNNTGNLGEILIRCNNVLYMGGVDGETGETSA